MQIIRSILMTALWVASASGNDIEGSKRSEVLLCTMRKNLCYVRASFGHAKNLSVIIDTGSSLSALNQRRAAELRLNPSATGTADGDGTGSDATYHLYDDVTIRVGRVSLVGESIVTLDLDYISQGMGYPSDGTIGSNLFNGYIVDFDYLNGRVTLTEKRKWVAPSNREKLALAIEDGVPYVEGTLDLGQGRRIQGKFLIDTGQVGSAVSISREFQKAHPELLEKLKLVPTQTTAVGGTIRLLAGRLPAFQLGTFSVKNPTITIDVGAGETSTESNIAGAIGADLLSQFDLAFDYSGQLLHLRRNTFP
jgi:hypothetical protein